MPQLDLQQKLAILADAAKYDASCASSGTKKRDSLRRQGDRLDRGDGHLPRLCAGRALHLAAQDPADQQPASSIAIIASTARARTSAARASPPRRWCGSPSLSTGAIISRACSSPPASSARPITRWSGSSRSRAALREDHDFRGYIHLKTIPDADPELVRPAGLHRRPGLDQRRAADRGRPRPARAGEGWRAGSRAR